MNFIKIYNQTLEYFTRNGCTAYTLFHMLMRDYYKRPIKEEYIKKFLLRSEKAKKWSQTWGAYFNKIYNYFCEVVFEKTGLSLEVVTLTISSGEVEKSLKNGHSFGLGLLKANATYKNVVKDGVLTNSDVDTILKSKGGVGHNHMLTYNQDNGKMFIIESLGFVDNTIEITYDVLRYAVKKGLYGDNARTLVPKDEFTKKVAWYLKELQNGERSEKLLEKAPPEEKAAVVRATRVHLLPIEKIVGLE